jgi:hypothetical protein
MVSAVSGKERAISVRLKRLKFGMSATGILPLKDTALEQRANSGGVFASPAQHKIVILRACDFFDLSVFSTPQPDVFNLHHKADFVGVLKKTFWLGVPKTREIKKSHNLSG